MHTCRSDAAAARKRQAGRQVERYNQGWKSEGFVCFLLLLLFLLFLLLFLLFLLLMPMAASSSTQSGKSTPICSQSPPNLHGTTDSLFSLRGGGRFTRIRLQVHIAFLRLQETGPTRPRRGRRTWMLTPSTRHHPRTSPETWIGRQAWCFIRTTIVAAARQWFSEDNANITDRPTPSAELRRSRG